MKFKLQLFILILTGLIFSCRSVEHKTGFDLQKEVMSELPEDSTVKKQIYITSTVPIDSVDVNKVIFDIYRHEIKDYPKEVRLIARVFDSTGRFVTNMANPYLKNISKNYWTGLSEVVGKKLRKGPIVIDSFKVREYGANDSIPYNISLTVDYSGSMVAVLDAIQEGTEIFVNMKMRFDNIGISSFNQAYLQQVPLTNDKNKIINLYRTHKKEGIGLFSAVNDAIYNAMEILKNTDTTAPRVLVVFSDGDDNYSKKQIGEIIDTAKKYNIFVFAVAFGYSKDDNLRTIAKYTGGKFYVVSSKEELISVFRDIYMSLRYFYLVSYKPPVFWGIHDVTLKINVPNRTDSLLAYDEYDTSDLYPGDSSGIGKAFDRIILFDFDSAVVKPISYDTLDEMVDKMLTFDNLKLEIQGHTDNIGPKANKIEYNQALSERRAKAVYDYMIKRGASAKNLRWRGFGMSKPIAPNETEEGRAKNRRTTFLVIAK